MAMRGKRSRKPSAGMAIANRRQALATGKQSIIRWLGCHWLSLQR